MTRVDINLSELKPSIKMAMDIMDIYKAEFRKHDIKVNITLINNLISINVDETGADEEIIKACFGEALNNASKYIEETIPRPTVSFSIVNAFKNTEE